MEQMILVEKLLELQSVLMKVEANYNTLRNAHDRAIASYAQHAEAANQLWEMLQKREGKYANDETAKSWTQIIHEHYLQAKAIWDIYNDDLPAGMHYSPPGVPMTGKTS